MASSINNNGKATCLCRSVGTVALGMSLLLCQQELVLDLCQALLPSLPCPASTQLSFQAALQLLNKCLLLTQPLQHPERTQRVWTGGQPSAHQAIHIAQALWQVFA